MQKVSKTSVNYRPAAAAERCGNCAMLNFTLTCDLVKGWPINPDAVCDKWVKVVWRKE